MSVTLTHFDGIRDRDRATVLLRRGPFRIRWEAEHQDYLSGRRFVDVQRRGPFRYWKHTHRVIPEGSDACRLIDEIEYALPCPGRVLAGTQVRRALAAVFAYRHHVTRADLALYRHDDRRPLRIALTGASGLLGTHLVPFLTAAGHEVLRLVRTPSVNRSDEVYWNPRTGDIDADRLEALDAVVHLAGENVFAVRWTPEKKRRIYDSRVVGTRLLCETLARSRRPPPVLLSASGIGIYGDRGDTPLDEDAPSTSGNGFLARVCRDWESVTSPAAEAGIRVVHLRLGVVLSPRAGALHHMLPVFRAGLGGPIGRGARYLSWISVDDVIYALFHLITTPSLQGPVNLTAPHPASSALFARMLSGVLRRPGILPIPPPVLRAVMGEAGEEILLMSARVLPGKLLRSGYSFHFPELAPALRHLLGRGA